MTFKMNGDYMCIVMEQLSAVDLFDYVCKRGALREHEAKRLFRQLIDGVDYCHTSRVVHRDLKAENILLDDDTNVKIADFGLAAELKPGEKLRKSCGSLHYAAPELLYKGCSYDGPEIDVWSCGVILYALLTGCLPFDVPNCTSLRWKEELVKLIKQGRFEVPRFISPDAKDLIGKMLTVIPGKRITIAEIRKHRWFLNGAAAEVPTLPHLLPQMRNSATPAKSPDVKQHWKCHL